MIEQMTLFGERDQLSMVCEYMKSTYEERQNWYRKYEQKPYPLTFDEFVLDHFSGYQGGTAPATFESEGWTQYGCSSKGLELWKKDGAEWISSLVKKERILKALGITDDNKEGQ